MTLSSWLILACGSGAAEKRASADSATASIDSMTAGLVTVDGVLVDTLPGRWRVTSTTDAMDDTPIYSFSLSSDHRFAPSANLGLRCAAGRTELYVMSGPVETSYGDGGGTIVRYRFDEGKAVTARWSESTNFQGIFAPNPIPMAKQIADARRLRIEYREHGGGVETKSYRTGGLAALLPKLAETCKWNVHAATVSARSTHAPPREGNSSAAAFTGIRGAPLGRYEGRATAQFRVDSVGDALMNSLTIVAGDVNAERAVRDSLFLSRFSGPARVMRREFVFAARR
jgi:hypothetical protein